MSRQAGRAQRSRHPNPRSASTSRHLGQQTPGERCDATAGHTSPERSMPHAIRPGCTTPGCGRPRKPGGSKCEGCGADSDRDRPSGASKYGQAHRARFRPGVLKRDPACTCRGCTGHNGPCARPSEVADHWPLDRVDLIARGMDPDDPENGRGLCKPCHDRHTAATRPAGFRSG